jgi:hypothetical protein
LDVKDYRSALLVTLALALAASGLINAGCGGTTPDPFVPPTPVLSVAAISPSRGATIGTTDVTVTGVAFAAGMSVTIGGVAAANVRVQSSTTLLATAGPHDAGQVDVVVSLDGRSATLPGAFTYAVPAPGTLPVITGFTAQGSRLNVADFVEVGDEIVVTATVQQPPGTTQDQLTFEWSAESGTITPVPGTGLSVRWRAPQQVSAVPTDVTLTLKISRSIDVARPYQPASTVSVSASTTVRVRNSIKEVSDLSVNFLEMFSDSTIPAERTVVDFWDGCQGKWEELGDVINNRNLFFITSHRIDPPTEVLVNFGGRCAYGNMRGDACIAVPCLWNDVRKSSGQPGTSQGIDHLTAVYGGAPGAPKRWWLCDSGFEATSPNSTLGFIR